MSKSKLIRGCGTRTEGLYVCVELSPFGLPFEHFIVDPSIRWDGPRLRAPMLIEDKNGICHLIMSVGAQYYPYCPDFLVEAEFHGLSKRVPRNFDPSRLTPGKSKLLLVHPRAIPQFEFEAEFKCPKALKAHEERLHKHLCIGALWPLSAVDMGEKHRLVEEARPVANVESGEFEKEVTFKVVTPSVSYPVNKPMSPKLTGKEKYKPGVILAFGVWHFEWVGRQAPKEVKERIETAEFRLECVPE